MNTIICFVLISFIVFSCTPPLYIPNTTNITTLIKKGDLDGSVSAGTNGWDIQGGYAITDEIGVTLNGSYGMQKSDSSDNFTNHLFGEAGIAYTFILNKSSEGVENDLNYISTTSGGIGIGTASGLVINTFFTSDSNYASGIYNRYFIQSSIGISSIVVDFFLTYRLTYVSFINLTYNYIDSVQLYDIKNYNIFHEPTIHISLGFENIKFFGQVGLSISHFDNFGSGNVAFRQRPVIFIIGLKFDFNVFENFPP